ncbi:MAG: DsbA family oxidoreductase [Pseudomonadota bacterium]|nr:DsbA family oxidoreductase [Pseudomonadota bacterium]
MKIDFVSDVACPWCAVGLNALEAALQNIGTDIPVELHFQPFELNPDMAPEGADAAAYLKAKYGMGDAQLASNRQNIRQRGAEVGFEFGERMHVWNTFAAHRLLYWAGAEGPPDRPHDSQRKLKHLLLAAYHGQGRNPGATDVLVDLAEQAGLDPVEARAVLEENRYADEVRAAEHRWQQAGIHSVPSVIINDRHLITGGQPAAVFEQALRKIAAESASASTA